MAPGGRGPEATVAGAMLAQAARATAGGGRGSSSRLRRSRSSGATCAEGSSGRPVLLRPPKVGTLVEREAKPLSSEKWDELRQKERKRERRRRVAAAVAERHGCGVSRRRPAEQAATPQGATVTTKVEKAAVQLQEPPLAIPGGRPTSASGSTGVLVQIPVRRGSLASLCSLPTPAESILTAAADLGGQGPQPPATASAPAEAAPPPAAPRPRPSSAPSSAGRPTQDMNTLLFPGRASSPAPGEDDDTNLLLSSSIGLLAARPVTPLSAPALSQRPTSASQRSPSSTSMGIVAPRPATPLSAGRTRQSHMTPLGVNSRRPSSAQSDGHSGRVDMAGCKRLPSTPQGAPTGGGGVKQVALGVTCVGLRSDAFERLQPRGAPATDAQPQQHQLSNREIAAARQFLTSAPGKRPSSGGLEASRLQRRPASAPSLSRPGQSAKPSRNLEADQAAATRRSNFNLKFVSDAAHSKMYMQSTYTSAFPRRIDTTTPFKRMDNLSFTPTML